MKKIVLLILIFLLFSFPGLAQESEKVEFAQSRLETLGYRPGPIDGYIGPKTRDAITAFQKQAGLETTQRLDEETFVSLEIPKVSNPKPIKSSPEKVHLEVNLEKQLLYLVEEDKSVRNVFHISSGEGETTPTGEFVLRDAIDGRRFDEDGWVTARDQNWKPQGQMYRPLVIDNPIYLHGRHEVPVEPDTLGCVGLMPRHMDYIWEIYTSSEKVRIFVYKGP